MERDIALAIYFDKPNRYSFNALLGAIEGDEYLSDLKIYFINDESELCLKIEQILSKHREAILLFSFFTTQLLDIEQAVKRLRLNYGDRLKLIAGGAHPTGDPYGTLKIGFDIVVIGEGEESFKELLKRYLKGDDIRVVKGLAIFELGKYLFTGKREKVDLDKYLPISISYGKVGPIEITRGCPYRCYFCQTPRIFGTKIRHRSVEKICEVVELVKRRGVKDIRFITPNALSYGSIDGKTVALDKIEALLKGIRKVVGEGVKIFFGTFPSEIRPEHVTKEVLELIRCFANNDNLIIGAQSGSERILESVHRGHSVGDIYRATELTIKSGFKANVDFIFGLPQETEKDIKETIKVINDLINMGARIHAHTFIPLPQTPFVRKPPGKIKKELTQLINKLLPKGVIYGDWRRQQRLAEIVSSYFNKRDRRSI